jgi:hypothetical protein
MSTYVEQPRLKLRAIEELIEAIVKLDQARRERIHCSRPVI